MIKKSLNAVLAAVFFLTVSYGYSLAQQARQAISSDSVIETIKQDGVIKIGLSLFSPWAMRDKNGDLVGFELDVGRELAKDMGVEVEFVPVAWDGIIPALVSSKFDVIISGMSVTPARNLTVNFTDPYAYSGVTILANKHLVKGMKESDFNNPDVKLALRRGSTPATAAKKHFPKATILLFDEEGASLQEVLNGNAHASLASEPYPTIEVLNYPETLTVPFDTLYMQSGEAFALRKGDPDAINFFNNWIAAKHRDGFLKNRHDYWFKSLDWKK